MEEDGLPAVVAKEPEPLTFEEPIHDADQPVATGRLEGGVVEDREGGRKRTIRRRLRHRFLACRQRGGTGRRHRIVGCEPRELLEIAQRIRYAAEPLGKVGRQP